MRKKLLIVASVLLISLPTIARAWQLSGMVNTSGESISVRGGTPATSTKGMTVCNSYTTEAATQIPVAVAPSSACYATSYDTKGGAHA